MNWIYFVQKKVVFYITDLLYFTYNIISSNVVVIPFLLEIKNKFFMKILSVHFLTICNIYFLHFMPFKKSFNIIVG